MANGDRLISSSNPEELCSKSHVSLCCTISFDRSGHGVDLDPSDGFPSGFITIQDWCTNLMAPRNRRSLRFFLFACWYIWPILGWTLVCGRIVGQVGLMWRCKPETLLRKQTRFFRLDDIFKVIFGSLTFWRSGWPPVNEPNHCSRFHFEGRHV